MSDDALRATADLAELARLTTAVRDLRELLAQKERAIEAERRARELAEAELDAARAVVAAAHSYLTKESKYLPIEKASIDAIGDFDRGDGELRRSEESEGMMHECPDCGQACDCDGDDVWNDYGGLYNCRHACEDDYEDEDGLGDLECCVDCGDMSISATCECCGGWLCYRHAETGAGFCKSCPTQAWIDEQNVGADALSPQSSSLSPGN